MAINTQKVMVGGLAAGVVANVIGFVGFGVLLAPSFEADLMAAAPTLQGAGTGGGAIAATVVSTFVIGVLTVWLYAAIRPRFGPGMKTAMYAAAVVWVCGFVFHLDPLLMGLMSTTTYALASVIAAVQVVATAAVGGMLYKEEGTAM
jgi:hypothetical protein